MKPLFKFYSALLITWGSLAPLSGCYRFKPEDRPTPPQAETKKATALPGAGEPRLSEAALEAWLKRLKQVEGPIDTIQAGDGFNLVVYNEPELNLKGLVVQPDGFLHLPLIGPYRSRVNP